MINTIKSRLTLGLAAIALSLGFAGSSQAQQLPHGYFWLTTNWMESRGMALEGNDGCGRAIMTTKGNASGQLWKAVQAPDGYIYSKPP